MFLECFFESLCKMNLFFWIQVVLVELVYVSKDVRKYEFVGFVCDGMCVYGEELFGGNLCFQYVVLQGELSVCVCQWCVDFLEVFEKEDVICFVENEVGVVQVGCVWQQSV